MNKDSGGVASPDIDSKTGQPIEEAEDNLSRHSTADSSPPIEEQERTSVGEDPERPGGSSSGDMGEN
ncbi:MAG TPA: hypothetical protein VF717_02155 [Pyrinomonadaceae bacterium]|jgi:hypothetical protein